MPASDRPTDAIASFLPDHRSWTEGPTPADLTALPSRAGVLLFVDSHGAPVQLAATQQLRHFVQARLDPRLSPGKRRADIRAVVRGVRWRTVHCAFEGRWWYYRLARTLYPDDYRRRVSFGPAWFLRVDWTRPVPEIDAAERVWCEPGEFVGAWPTQKAVREALEQLVDLFDLCRYPQQVRRAPRGTRCAYADMGRCDAPCDGTVPLAAYVARCRAAWRLACGDRDPWQTEAEQRMRQAASNQQFEEAARIREQIQVGRNWGPKGVPRLQTAGGIRWLLGFPATNRQAWKLCLFRNGDIVDGPVVAHRKAGLAAQEWLHAEMDRGPEGTPPEVRMEQTWLVCHEFWRAERHQFICAALTGAGATHGIAHVVQDQADALRSRRAGGGARVEQDGARPPEDQAIGGAGAREDEQNCDTEPMST